MNDKVIPDLDIMPEKNINRIGFLGNFSPFSKTTSNLFYFVLLFQHTLCNQTPPYYKEIQVIF